MKRTIATIVFALIAATAFSQDQNERKTTFTWLEFGYDMEIGYLPLNGWVIHDTQYTDNGQDFYLTMRAELVFAGFLFVGGLVRTDMSFKNSNINFSPSEMWYEFEAGLRFGGFEIGYRHMCTHPIIPYIFQNFEDTDTNAEGSYHELYLSFKGKVKLF